MKKSNAIRDGPTQDCNYNNQKFYRKEKKMKFPKKITALCLSALTVFSASSFGAFAASIDKNEPKYKVEYNPEEHGAFLSEDEIDDSVSIYGKYIAKSEYEDIIRNNNEVGAYYHASFYGCYDTHGNRIYYVSSVDGVHSPGTPMNSMMINGQRAYCIQPGVHTGEWVSYSDTSTGAWENLSFDQRRAINTALCYGREGNFANLSSGTTINSSQAWCATQIVIWEIVRGVRNATYPFALKSGQSGYIGLTCAGGRNTNIRTAYNRIVNGMSTYQKFPTFSSRRESDAPTYHLKAVYNEATKKWTYESLTLTDNNNILNQFSQFNGKTANVGNGTVKMTVSGNKLTLSIASANLTGTPKTSTVSVAKTGIPQSSSGVLVSYAASGYQDMVSGGNIDPPTAFINVEIETRTMGVLNYDGRIQKVVQTPEEFDDYSIGDDEGSLSTSENVEGWYFQVTAPTAFRNQYGVSSFILGPTDKTGFTQSISDYVIKNLNYSNVSTIVPAGYYSFTELGKKDSNGRYYFPDFYERNVTGTLYINQNANLDNVGFAYNIFNIPTVIYKTNEDGSSTENYAFQVTNKETGEPYIITSLGEKGCSSRDITQRSGDISYVMLPEGSYTLKELGVRVSGTNTYKIPDRFEEPAEIDFEVSAEAFKTAQENGDKAITIHVLNKCSGYITIQKSEEGNPSKRVKGAVYGVFSDEDCLEMIYQFPPTDENGEAVSEIRFACNSQYYVKEVETAPHYELNDTVYPVTILPEETEVINYVCEVSDVPVHTGSVTLHKTDNNDVPLSGTTWQLMTLQREVLQFTKAEDGKFVYDVDGTLEVLPTDSKGVLVCSELPIGDYYLVEVSTADKRMPYASEIPFTISDESESTLNVSLTVKNSKAVLSETGGSGNNLSYAIGLFLSIPAFIGITSYKKLKKERTVKK